MALHNKSSGARRSSSFRQALGGKNLIRMVLAASLLAASGGCEEVGNYLNLRNSFMNPAEVGRFDKANPWGAWEVRPVRWPILSQLDVVEEASNKWSNATDPTPADLVPEVHEYALQAGDAINVSIYELLVPGVEYTRQLRINEVGYVNIQNVGNILVSGLTPTQMEQKIAQTLVDQKILPAQPGPQVQVSLLESRQKIFSISGAVGHAGPYNIVANDFKLWDAIVMAGDIPYQPGMDYLYVIRTEHPQPAATGEAGAANGTIPGLTPATSSGTTGPVAPHNPAADLESIEKSTQTAPATSPAETTNPASAPPAIPGPASAPGAKADLPKFVRPLPTAMVLAQADMDAALGVSGSASAPASSSAPATASAPADHDLLDKAAASQPGEQVYVDGKWVSVAATQAGSAPATPGVTPPMSGVAATAMAPTTAPEAVAAATPGAPDANVPVQRIIRIPIVPLLEGVSKYNIIVRPGDIIRVPPIDPGEFYLMGNIGRPGVYTLTGRKVTLKMAIAAAGNLGALAIPRRCDLIRRIGDDQEAIIQVNLQKIFDGEQPDIFLKPNDLVNIGTDAIAPFLAVTRNAYRASYGWGFVYDKNLNDQNNTTNNNTVNGNVTTPSTPSSPNTPSSPTVPGG